MDVENFHDWNELAEERKWQDGHFKCGSFLYYFRELYTHLTEVNRWRVMTGVAGGCGGIICCLQTVFLVVEVGRGMVRRLRSGSNTDVG